MNLTSTSDIIRVVTASAVTTDVQASWDDQTTSAFTPGRTNTAITTATTTTVVASPDASTQRRCNKLIIQNTHASSSNLVTVQHYDGSTAVTVAKYTLLAGEQLTYANGEWRVFDASGQVKGASAVADGDKGDITVSASGATYTIDADAVTNAKLANMADSTIKGSAVGAGTANPTDLTAAQAQAIIDTTTSALSPFARYTGKHIGYAASATNQSTTSGTDTYLNLPDTDVIDTDTMHYTSSAALTGTVTKTAASVTIAGSGTLFSSELSVGQMISIPGTAVEYFVVTAIASNTSLTVSAAAANTAAGQTATRMNSAVVVVTAGTYLVLGKCRFQSAAGGIRQLVMQSKRTVALANEKRAPVVSDSTDMSTWGLYAFAQWDWIELRSTQNSGTVNVNTADLALIRVGN